MAFAAASQPPSWLQMAFQPWIQAVKTRKERGGEETDLDLGPFEDWHFRKNLVFRVQPLVRRV
jgi:hypothetical protein